MALPKGDASLEWLNALEDTFSREVISAYREDVGLKGLLRNHSSTSMTIANSSPPNEAEEPSRIVADQRAKIMELNTSVAQAMQLLNKYADVMTALTVRIETLEAEKATLAGLVERVEAIEVASLKSNPNYGRF